MCGMSRPFGHDCNTCGKAVCYNAFEKETCAKRVGEEEPHSVICVNCADAAPPSKPQKEKKKKGKEEKKKKDKEEKRRRSKVEKRRSRKEKKKSSSLEGTAAGRTSSSIAAPSAAPLSEMPSTPMAMESTSAEASLDAGGVVAPSKEAAATVGDTPSSQGDSQSQTY